MSLQRKLSRKINFLKELVAMDFPRCGEIYPVNFDPTIGHETKKARPALIITNDINNEYSPVVTVIPLSGNVIYELTKDFPKYEIYGITNQLRRAAVSRGSGRMVSTRPMSTKSGVPGG